MSIEINYLYHGTDKNGLIKILKGEALGYSYYEGSHTDKYTHGLFLTSDINKARQHGLYILELSLTYDSHVLMLEICKLNKIGDTASIIDLGFDYEADCCDADWLDELQPECFYMGVVKAEHINTVYIPNGDLNTMQQITELDNNVYVGQYEDDFGAEIAINVLQPFFK